MNAFPLQTNILGLGKLSRSRAADAMLLSRAKNILSKSMYWIGSSEPVRSV